MANILDLPAEILIQILSNLKPKGSVNREHLRCAAELARIARTCKPLQKAAILNLYEDITFDFWRFGSCDVAELEKERRVLHALLTTLSTNVLAAEAVLCLELADFEYGSSSESFKDENSSTLLGKLSNLRFLSIQNGWPQRLLSANLVMPALEFADLMDQRSEHLDIIMSQPQLRVLVLHNGQVPALATRPRSSTVTHLSLSRMTNPQELQGLITTSRSLKSLFWTKGCSYGDHKVRNPRFDLDSDEYEYGSCEKFPLSDIAPVLGHVSESLERLMMTHDQICALDRTVMTSLMGMSSLRYLQIEPWLFLGRRTCVNWVENQLSDNPFSQRDVSEFAKLLPSGIEKLALEIDREQCDRIPFYGVELVNSILKARKRLSALYKIVVEECNESYAGHDGDEGLCFCEPKNACYLSTRNDPVSVSERDRILATQQACTAVRIDLRYATVRSSPRNPLWPSFFVRTLFRAGKLPESFEWSFWDFYGGNGCDWGMGWGGDVADATLPLESSVLDRGHNGTLLEAWEKERVKQKQGLKVFMETGELPPA
ncbi:hypothetical protein H2200_001971 [Cladophialophora chaetospira]|uniref:F-box domain-containing protein n=1 Tax=Cladophialophora chaetospira TaxID=386627 RepID=A0AA39CPK2_9EURO|nr:hypothetical protein H2200_001971 [Cladophialophora chaetospira]